MPVVEFEQNPTMKKTGGKNEEEKHDESSSIVDIFEKQEKK